MKNGFVSCNVCMHLESKGTRLQKAPVNGIKALGQLEMILCNNYLNKNERQAVKRFCTMEKLNEYINSESPCGFLVHFSSRLYELAEDLAVIVGQ